VRRHRRGTADDVLDMLGDDFFVLKAVLHRAYGRGRSKESGDPRDRPPRVTLFVAKIPKLKGGIFPGSVVANNLEVKLAAPVISRPCSRIA